MPDPKKNNPNKLNSPQEKKNPPYSPKQTVMVWLLVLAGIFLFMNLLDSAPMGKATELEYSQFQALLTEHDSALVSAKIVQKGGGRATLSGEVRDSTLLQKIAGGNKKVTTNRFVVNLPFIDSEMLSQWDNRSFSYVFKEKGMGALDIILSVAPLLLIVFFFLMFRNMQGGGQKGMFTFGKSRAKLHSMDKPQYTFDDVAGADEAKAELAEIVDFLKAPDKYRKLGGEIPKGVLLLGSPGTGKTLLAKAVAGEAMVPFFSMSGSDFVEMFVGVGASRVRDLFDTAKKNAPCIIFIDEIDAVGRQRGAGVGGGHDEREQTLNQMLVEMDGFEENSGIILIAATNRPDVLDPALLRPGRFDRQVVVNAPNARGREAILTVHTKNVPLSEDVDLLTIARGTPGFVGADLANLVNEAALMAARFNQDNVTMLDFEEAKDKIIMGTERRSLVLSEEERRITAYHEAGHAICTLHCEHADTLHKVTIIPRGRALGVTFSLPGEDRHSYSKEFILDRICVAMGGRVAENLLFNRMTTGASNDIKQSTDLVRKMICDYGMSDLGPISYGQKEEQIFLGREIANHRDYSEKTAEDIDRLMQETICAQEKRAEEIITKYRIELDRLAEALVEHELLDREEIDIVIAGEPLERAKKSRDTELSLQKTAQEEKTGTSIDLTENSDVTAPKEETAEDIARND